MKSTSLRACTLGLCSGWRSWYFVCFWAARGLQIILDCRELGLAYSLLVKLSLIDENMESYKEDSLAAAPASSLGKGNRSWRDCMALRRSAR